jgi:DNA-binding transcriptional LysR family regulator
MDRLTAIRVFIEVVDRGSLTAAADAMDISRAMTSRYVGELEKWLGIRLLQRSTRKISLTSAGQEVLSRLREMLDLSEDVQSIKDSNQLAPHGILRVAASTSLGCTELSKAAADYVLRYPGTVIDLQLSERTVNLIEDRIDVAVRITNDLNPGLIARKLSVCRSVVVASPTYLQRHGTPAKIEALSEHNCLTHSYVGKNLWRFTRDGEAIDVAVTGNINTNDANALLSIVLSGVGIAMLPNFLVAPMIQSGELIVLVPEATPKDYGIYGVYTSRKQMPAILRTFLDFLAERFGNEPYWDSMIANTTNAK